jgi:hypothetical protein
VGSGSGFLTKVLGSGVACLMVAILALNAFPFGSAYPLESHSSHLWVSMPPLDSL